MRNNFLRQIAWFFAALFGEDERSVRLIIAKARIRCGSQLARFRQSGGRKRSRTIFALTSFETFPFFASSTLTASSREAMTALFLRAVAKNRENFIRRFRAGELLAHTAVVQEFRD